MTQEFVTLPREVVEQALEAMTAAMGAGPYKHRCSDAAEALRAAFEQPQNHVPDVGNMVQSGWNLVPVEPTEEMLRAGCGSESPAMFRESLRRETDGQKTVEMVEKIIQRNLNSYRAMLAAAPQPPVVEQHTDDAAVNRFAEAMKAKLAVARDKGRGGWDDPAQCTVEYLAKLLVDHIAKGDPIDVANFAMMLHQRQADKSVLSAAAPTPTAVDHPEPAYLLRDLAYDICVDVPDLIVAIREAGLGNYSVNMALPAKVCVAMCQRFSAVEQEPVAWLKTWNSVGHARTGMQRVDLTPECETWLANMFPTITPLYTHPLPKRELTKEEARRIYNEATYHASIAVFMTRMDAEHQDADDKGVSGWLQEAEDRVKHRTIDAAHEIGQAAAPQQGEQEPAATLHCTEECYVYARATDAGKRIRFEQPIDLYTHPQPKREPLTHYEIHELFRRSLDDCQDGDEIKAFARAIEAAHGIK